MAALFPHGRILLGAILLGFASVFATSPEDFVGPTAAPPAQPAPGTPAAGKPVAPAPGPKAAAPLPAKPASVKPVPARTVMDTAQLHSIYLEGDFDKAIRIMEGSLKNKKALLTHADSVFIYKHLGVMYAATPTTREKGRYYMAQLIYIEPTAKILDMYASDMIYLIFHNVQEEFQSRHPNIAMPAPKADTTPAPVAAVPAPAPVAPAAQAAPSKSKTRYWITGGAVVAAGTVGLLFVLLDNPKPKKRNIDIPE
jgi:hypothetical protein